MQPPNAPGLGEQILATEQQPVQIQNPRQSSIELKMSVKGERYWDLKVYCDHTDRGDVVAATDWLKQMDFELRHTYLRGNS